MNVLEPVQFSDWAAPIVPVPKSDGSVRIYKVTINRAAKVDQYPIPKIDDLFSSLAGDKKFTNLTYHTHTFKYNSTKLLAIT